jgi:hypothetical protein
MSTHILSSCSCLLTSIIILHSSIAQVSKLTVQRPIEGANHTIKVYENVQSEFIKQFGNATNITWSKVNKNYLAKFKIDGQQNSVLFNPRASIVYRISYGDVHMLPAQIRKSIKRMYVEFEIPSVVKVEEAGRTIWWIIVEDEASFARIKVENDDFEEVEKINKDIPLSTVAKH